MTISIDLTPAEHYGVYRAKLDMPWSRDEIISEMDSANWGVTHEQEVYADHYWTGARHKLYPENIDSSTPIMQSLQNYISGIEFKTKLVNFCYESMPRVFQESWSNWTPEKTIENTHAHAEFIKDGPGLVIPLHTDSRIVVGGGMIYFAETDDPRISTIFYNSYERGDPQRMTTNFCDGWWHANSNNTYHDGGNAADYTRYSMLFCLSVSTKTW